MDYDIIIVGGGPAGLTAALYALRANKKVLITEKNTFGGQVTYSPKIENFPGFVSVSGNELADKLVDQVLSHGADVEIAEVTKIIDGEVKTVVTDIGSFTAGTVIIATGAKHRRLGLNNEEELIGHGISFCAVCDGAFCNGKTVAVVGGGNSAMQEAILLTENASKVYVIQDLDFLTGEKKLAEQLESNGKVEIVTGSKVTELIGDGDLKAITVETMRTGEKARLDIDGLFVAIGLVPQNEAFTDLIEIDDAGYAVSDENCVTKSGGIFVAGDCRTKSVRQIATAVADGASAALAACKYLENRGEKGE